MANPDGPWVRFFASDWLAGTRGMTAAETGVYITLIALMYENDGMIERDDRRLARQCGLKQHMFAAMLADLIEAGKITVSGSKLGNDRATYESQNRADRAIKARNAAEAKHQRKQGGISASASPKQAPSSAPEVLRARVSEPEPDSSDIESSEATQPKKNARGSRLPADWSIPNDWGKWAVEEFGEQSGRVRAEADRFRDYWIAQPGQKGVKLDWLATWRNWCRTAFATKPTGRQNRETTSDVAREILENIENAERESSRISDRPPAGYLSSPVER